MAVAIPPTARPIIIRIIDKLTLLERQAFTSPLDKGFRALFAEVADLAVRYQEEVVARSDYTVSCTRGCSDCCNHWVEDVNSFEAAIIADFIRRKMPGRVDDIRRRCISDCHELERLEKLVTIKLQRQQAASGVPSIDQVDLLLSVFYQMKRPCPLLADDGNCSIYELRPLTCRIYVSFSDPLRCNPGYINTSVVPTCLIDLPETANRILDTLHFRYLRINGDTGLRSQVGRYLSDDHT